MQRIQSLQAEAQKIQAQQYNQQQQESISLKNLQSQRKLAQPGYLSALALEEFEAQYLQLQNQGQEIQRASLQWQRQIAEAQNEATANRLRANNRVADYQNQRTTIDQQIIELSTRIHTTVRAPIAGQMSGALLQVGQTANPQTPLLTLMPQGAALQTKIYAPSRAIGFIKTGQRVNLRLDAFPYTRFGSQNGQIQQVSRALLLPNEIANLPNNQAAYPVTVTLKNQSLVAYGEPWPLKAGMTFEADVIMEKQRIIEWILEPLFALKRS